MIELTIEQAKQHPANFLYCWADKQFLSYINPKHAAIIRGKGLNQKKLIALSADKYGKTIEEYYTAISEAFKEMYGMTPKNALVALASGQTVAGKNWEEGVYGIGANVTYYGTSITVDAKTGHIFKNGTDITDESKTVYSTINGKAVPYQYFAVDGEKTYQSQYNKITKSYSAYSYSTGGQNYSAKTGKVLSGLFSGDLWGTITMSLGWFGDILKWLLSLFGITSSQEQEIETINADNTLPNQKADGFVFESGLGEAGIIALAVIAGGTLLATGGIGGKKSRK